MSKTSQTRRPVPAPREMLLTLLETLPDALFVVDDNATIVYANASAQSVTGATREEVLGKPLWRGIPQVVSTTLYLAARRTRQTRAPTEVEYMSPVTGNWLHVQLTPTVEGLMLQIHQGRAVAEREAPYPQDGCLRLEDLDSLYSGIIILTPEGIVLEISEAPLTQAQVRREEIIGQSLAEARWWAFYPASQSQLRAGIARAGCGETVRFETVIHPREGVDHHLDISITPRRDEDGHIVYLVLSGINITTRKRAELQLTTSERNWRALAETVPQLVWIEQADGTVEYVNHHYLDYLQAKPEQLQSGRWSHFVHAEDIQRTLAAWHHACESGEPYEIEYRLKQGKTGAYRWFLVRALPVHDETGQIIKWFGTCTDIENQKRTEQQLKESQESLRVLSETLPQLVWTTRPDGRIDYCNQRLCDLAQADFEQIRDYEWRQFLHPDDAEHALTLRNHSLATGEPFENEHRLWDGGTGTYRWFLARALPMRDETGHIAKWFGTCTDIENQKLTEEALRQSQERANALMSSNIIGITVFEGEQIVDANDSFLHMTGYTREDLRAGHLNWLQMTPPEDRARTFEALQEFETRQLMTPYEKEYICQDGSRLPVLVGAVALQHHPSQAIAFVLDNSARKELEQRKDDFISMASHELRNPLTALKLYTTLLRRQLARQGLLNQISALASMESQIKAISRLVEEMLDVSKIQTGSLEYIQERVELDALLREIADTMQYTHPSHHILVRGTIGTSLIGDRDRLGEVFNNLLSNAVKYSPGAQTVEVDLSASDEIVTIRVTDHGLGISREQRDKTFERFYRAAGLKRQGISGLGMGLYIVAEIVKHYRGTITVDSEVGKGSTFTVAFPTMQET